MDLEARAAAQQAIYLRILPRLMADQNMPPERARAHARMMAQQEADLLALERLTPSPAPVRTPSPPPPPKKPAR